MKIIDLLNKIANGEEVPKKIKSYQGQIYLYEDSGEYVCFETQDLLFDFPAFRQLGDYLNDEVEIIEEDKKIEKITLLGEEIKVGSLSNWLSGTTINEEKIASCIECNSMKINEIIDMINKD